MKRSPPKVLLAVGAPLMFAACATIGPPQPPSLELPKPPSDLRAARKGDHVTLTWTAPSVTTDRQTIRSVGSTRICRAFTRELMQCGIPVGEAVAQPSPARIRSSKQKIGSSYVDSLTEQLQTDNLSAYVTYAVEMLNAEGRGAGLSNQVRVPLARTLPPPRDFAARVSAQGVVLGWTGAAQAEGSARPAHYIYRVYRRPEGSGPQILIGEVSVESERSYSLTDSSIEWQKTYEYRAETVTVIAQEGRAELQIEGNDTPEIKVFANDVFPPATPSGLQAVSSGPGQKTFIDLVWAPAADIDLDGYNVYRHEEGEAAVKQNAEPVKTPAYRDVNVTPGKRYFYAVAAVDVRGNESSRSEEADETVP